MPKAIKDPTKPVTFRLRQSDIKRLRALSKKMDVSQAKVVRLALKDFKAA